MKTKVIRSLILVAFTIAPLSVFSTTYTWSGATGNWNDPTQWSPSGVPGNLDSVIIADGHLTINIQDTVTFLQFTGDTLSGNVNLIVLGDFVWNTGVITGVGTIEIYGKMKCNTGPVTLHDKIFNLQGGGIWTNTSFTMHGLSEFFIPAGDTLLIDITAGVRVMNGPSGKVTNQGTIIKNGNQQFWMDTPVFANTGHLVINGGTLTNGYNGSASFYNGATITIAMSGVLKHDGGSANFTNTTVQGAGTFQLTRSGAIYHFQSGNTITVTTFSLIQAVLNIDHELDFVNLTLSGGGAATLNTNYNHTISGNLSWNSCHINGVGVMTVNGNLSCSTATNTLTNKTITFSGNGSWYRSNFTMHGSSKVVIPTGKTLTITTDNANKGIFGSGGTLENLGTITKNGTYYFANDAAALIHTGVISINQGTFYNGYLGPTSTYNGGTITIASGAYFAPNGGTHTFTNTTITGSGTILIENGYAPCYVDINTGTTWSVYTWVRNFATITLNHPISVPAMDLDNNAVLSGSAEITVTGNFGMWGSGTLSGNGNIIVGGTCNATNANKTITDRVFIMDGGGTWYRSSFIMHGLSKFVVPANKMLTISADNTLYGITGSGGTIENLGLIHKVGGNHFAGNSLRLLNYGNIHIDEGVFSIGYGGADHLYMNGNIDIDEASILLLNGGVHIFDNTVITGAGDFRLENGVNTCSAHINNGNTISTSILSVNSSSILIINQNISLPEISISSGGQLETNNTVSIDGPLTWNGGTLTGFGEMIINGICQSDNFTNNLNNLKITLNQGGTWTNTRYNVTGSTASIILPVGDTLNWICDFSNYISGSGAMTIHGVLKVFDVGYFTVFLAYLEVTGKIECQYGNLHLGGYPTSICDITNGELIAPAMKFSLGTMNINGSTIHVQLFTIDAGAININDGNSLSGTTLIADQIGTININDTTVLDSLIVKDLSTYIGSTINIYAPLTIIGGILLNVAKVNLFSPILIQGFATIMDAHLKGPFDFICAGGYFIQSLLNPIKVEETSWVLSSDGSLECDMELKIGASLKNQPGNTITIGGEGDYDILEGPGEGSIINYGALRKIGNTTCTIEIPVHNITPGEINIIDGILILQ